MIVSGASMSYVVVCGIVISTVVSESRTRLARVSSG
jgi:hypothetical protein